MELSEQDKISILYKRHFSQVPDDIQPLKGDGSDRHYYRLFGQPTVIGVAGSNTAENRAFIYFSQHFKEHELPVPVIYCHDLDQGVYLEEDLGDLMLCEVMADPDTGQYVKMQLFQQALQWLPRFQITAGRSVDYSYCYQYDRFARDSMMWDMEYFHSRFLRVFYNDAIDLKALHDDFSFLCEHLLEAESDYFLYRDFQTRNIMVQGGQVRFIDYQSGRRGALQYDVVALLYDANVKMSESVRKSLLSFYLDQLCDLKGFDQVKFLFYFDGFAIIRLMQALGAFGFLSMVKGKKHFLKSIPSALKNLKSIMRRTTILCGLPELHRIFTRLVNDEELKALYDPALPHLRKVI